MQNVNIISNIYVIGSVCVCKREKDVSIL